VLTAFDLALQNQGCSRPRTRTRSRAAALAVPSTVPNGSASAGTSERWKSSSAGEPQRRVRSA
jgi:hypothetical protein